MIISFEGIDGSGKSTQVQMLVHTLREQGVDVQLVRDPGGTEVSERIRALLLDVDHDIDPFTEMLLYSAARAQLVRGKITSLLRTGQTIICDRFFDSTVAYQGGGRQVADLDWLEAFQKEVTAGIVPDRTYLIRVTLETAEARQKNRKADRMEQSDAAFFQRVIKAYDHLAEHNRQRFRVIDGEQAPEPIARTILEDLMSFPAFVASINMRSL